MGFFCKTRKPHDKKNPNIQNVASLKINFKYHYLLDICHFLSDMLLKAVLSSIFEYLLDPKSGELSDQRCHSPCEHLAPHQQRISHHVFRRAHCRYRQRRQQHLLSQSPWRRSHHRSWHPTPWCGCGAYRRSLYAFGYKSFKYTIFIEKAEFLPDDFWSLWASWGFQASKIDLSNHPN